MKLSDITVYCNECRKHISFTNISLDQTISVSNRGYNDVWITTVVAFDEENHVVKFTIERNKWIEILESIRREHTLEIEFDDGSKSTVSGDLRFVMTNLTFAYQGATAIKTVRMAPNAVRTSTGLDV